jgi:hypothetical protein
VSISIDPSELTLLRNPVPEWFDLERFPRLDHISPSMTNKFSDCPEAGRQRYILNTPERPAEAPLIGSAVHLAVERNMRQKIESHVDLPIAELLDWYDDEGFAGHVAGEQEKSGLEVEWDSSEEDAKTRGRLMLGEYHNKECPKIQPTAVEGKFSVPMGMPVPIEGRFDILCADRAIDLKTGKQKTTKPKAAWLIQAAIYQFATGLPVEFHTVSCSVKNHQVAIVTPLDSEALYLNQTISEVEAIQHVVRTVMWDALHYMRVYGPDTAWPTRGRFHMFACDYCSFKPSCPAWIA